MEQELAVNTDGLRHAAKALVDIIADLKFQPPPPPAQHYAASAGAAFASAAVDLVTAACGARINTHADGLSHSADKYDGTDGDGGTQIQGVSL